MLTILFSTGLPITAIMADQQAGRTIEAPQHVRTRFTLGDVVRHRVFDFRGVVFDIDPVFANSDDWYEAIPAAIRPSRVVAMK